METALARSQLRFMDDQSRVHGAFFDRIENFVEMDFDRLKVWFEQL